MSYNYSPGDGPSAFTASEPAQSDSIKLTCAVAIRQIKAFIVDTTTGGLANLFTRVGAVETAVGAITSSDAGKNLFRAEPSANIDIVHGAAGTINTDITLDSEIFDLDTSFAASIFTAPANGYYRFDAGITLFLQSGSTSYITADAAITPSAGSPIKLSNPFDDADTAQRSMSGGGVCYLTTGQTVRLSISTKVDAASTVRLTAAYTYLCGYRVR